MNPQLFIEVILTYITYECGYTSENIVESVELAKTGRKVGLEERNDDAAIDEARKLDTSENLDKDRKFIRTPTSTL